MKKLLILSTALAGVAMMSAPASAALTMKMGGFFRGYGVYSDSNEVGGASLDLRKYDIRRDSEVHFNGENTLDNGLTVGYHGELKTLNDAASASSVIDESYGYASGGWGRVNLGSADGAAYLLQVAAPSADSNVDGMRVFIAATTARSLQSTMAGTAIQAGGWSTAPALDYQHADFRQSERLSYMTPKFNGFQAGASYATKSGMNAIGNNTAGMDIDNNGIATPTNLWEAGARWDGEFQGFGMSVGAGYSNTGIERKALTGNGSESAVLATQTYDINDGVKTWNGGANVAFQGFSLGGNYKHSETSRIAQTVDAGDLAANVATGDITRNTYDIGLGYDNGPWHAGTSYLHQTTQYDEVDSVAGAGTAANFIAKTEFTSTKYTVGGGYTYGPGMTFRGAVAWGKFDSKDATPTAAEDNRFTQVTIGTNVAF